MVNNIKVLVVEDDAVMRTIELKNLREKGYQVLEAEDGKQGLAMIEKERPQVVLLDLLLPEVDGYQVLEAVRKHADPGIAATKILVFSNLWSDKDILRAQALKPDGFFVKASTTMEEIMEKIQEILAV